LGWQLSGIALVVALALLGHDSAMAGEAHEGRAFAPVSVVHRAPAHTESASPVGAGHHDRPSDGASDCGSLQPALPRAGAAGLALPPPDPIAVLDPALTGSVERVWSEPTWPPGTRRAQIQVYRM
jgi:hypothetical protein